MHAQNHSMDVAEIEHARAKICQIRVEKPNNIILQYMLYRGNQRERILMDKSLRAMSIDG